MAEWCTKNSSPDSPRMNPYPLVSLNHLTDPRYLKCGDPPFGPSCSNRERRPGLGGPPYVRPVRTDWMQSRQKTGFPGVGRKGTCVDTPQLEQTASWSSRGPPEDGADEGPPPGAPPWR